MSRIDKKTSSVKAFGVDIPFRGRRKPKSHLSESRMSVTIISKKEDVSTCTLPRVLYKTRDGTLAVSHAVLCHDTYYIGSEDKQQIKEEALCTIIEEGDGGSS